MMVTLTYGRKRPDDGDKGTEIFPALEANIDLDDGHNHNGTNSARLTSSASTAVTQAVLSAAWVSLGDGNYRQLVTMPGVIQFNTHAIQFRETVTGEIFYLSCLRNSANTYYVYINDSTLALTAVYS